MNHKPIDKLMLILVATAVLVLALLNVFQTDRPTISESENRTLAAWLYSVYEGQDMRQVTEVSGRTLLLCFTAPWCRHSTAMRNSLKELAEMEKGAIQVVEIDADTYPALANDYNLTKVPTTVFYTEGIKLRSIEGAFTADSLKRYLHALLTQEEENPQP